MKQGQLFWGTLLVVTGGLFLFREHLPLNFTWSLIRNLWPLALILGGVAVLLRGHKARILVAVLAAVLAGALLFGMISLFLYGERSEGPFTGAGAQTFSIPMRPDLTEAELFCDLGGTTFAVRRGGAGLVTATTASAGGAYSLESVPEGSRERVTFTVEPRGGVVGPWSAEHRAELLLSETPEWTLDLECGATSADLDFTGLRVPEVRISAGAARISLRLDALVPESRVTVETGVSSVTIGVPESAGCEIRTESALTRRRFPGFEKISSGLHRTENYDTAERRITIDLNIAVSTVRVERY